MASFVTFKVGSQEAVVSITASVSESWPQGGVFLPPGADVNAFINANPAGTMFRFGTGQHNMTTSLAVKANNYYIGDTPANKPAIVGPGKAGNVPFVNATVPGVTLKGLDVLNFGKSGTTEGAASIHFADGGAGTNWLIEDCWLGMTDNVIMRWGPGWTVRRTKFYDGGRYAVHGGTKTGLKLMEDCEWVHCGWVQTSNNRGGCKFSFTSGITVKRTWIHDIRGNGLWWDIANENGYAEDVTVEDCTRNGFNMEVCYGPFTFLRPIARRCGATKFGSEGPDWPIPGGVQCSMTPDITIIDPLVEDCRNGITVIQWAHPQIVNPPGGNEPSLCGNQNIIINGGTITNIDEWAAGLAGEEQAVTRDTGNIHYNNVMFDPNANFRSALHIN